MPIFIHIAHCNQKSSYLLEKLRGLLLELKKHRINYFIISSPEELKKHLNENKNEPSSIVFFPHNEEERKSVFNLYSKFNINKIVASNANVNTAHSNYSSITSDFFSDMEDTISHLKEKGCKNIALFNVNPNGYHDKTRINTYMRHIYHAPLIFYKNESIPHAILELLNYNNRIDAIICNNDYTAFSLMLVLNSIDANWNEKLLITSFSNTILSGICTPSLSSISFNYTTAGKKIYTIHNLLSDDEISHTHILMKNSLFKRETTQNNNPDGMIFSEHCTYSIEELFELTEPQKQCMELEKILLSCNISTLKIIHGLVLSKTIREICNDLFFHTDTVKYHIKKLKTALNFNTTAELSAFLKKWIDPEKFKEAIINDASFSTDRL